MIIRIFDHDISWHSFDIVPFCQLGGFVYVDLDEGDIILLALGFEKGGDIRAWAPCGVAEDYGDVAVVGEEVCHFGGF